MNKCFMLLAVAAVAFSSCQEDVLDGKGAPAKVGDEITFGGTLNVEKAGNAKTRTVYGDRANDANGVNTTEIKWIEGDKVRIYCNQAIPAKDAAGTTYAYCDYDVYGDGLITGTEGTLYNQKIEADKKYLQRNSAFASGLQWNTGGHTFYGVYPSPVQLTTGNNDDTEAAAELKLDENVVSGYLPNTQAPYAYFDAVGGVYTIRPAMRFAYMVATAQDVQPTSQGVTLSFKPIVTAVEVSIKNTGDPLEKISMVTLSSGSRETPICGSFKTTINSDGTFSNNNTASTTESTYSLVSIPVHDASGADVTLKTNEVLTFTAFLLPDADLSKLTLTIIAGGAPKTATLNAPTDGILVEATKKNFLTNIPLTINEEEQTNIDYSKWMEALPNTEGEPAVNTTLFPLSVPGAGGAWSGTKYNDAYSVGDMYREQNLDFAGLWNQGVRCFEMQVDDDFNLHCNNQSITDTDGTSLTFDEAMGQVVTKVNGGKEFAFVIVTYSNTDGVADRNSGSYQSTLSNKINTINKNNNNIVIPWQATTTIEEARGHVFVISRPGSIGVDYGWHGLGTANANVLSILGWGSMPDQWYARGFGKLQNYYSDCYTETTSSAFLSTNYSWKLIENSLDIYDKSSVNENTALRPFSAASGETAESFSYTYDKARSNFGYYAVTNTSRYGGLRTSNINSVWDNHNAWVQEWKRVADGDITVTGTNTGGDGNLYTYHWKDSKDEKWDDIVEALDKSMTDDKRASYSYYINSLCGYYITSKELLSYVPALNVQRYGTQSASGNSALDILNVDFDIEKLVYCDGKYQGQVTKYEQSISASINYSVTNWGPYNPNAGLAGDVESYAKWVNDKFYNHVLSITAANGGKFAGPTGIVLMDRVSGNVNEPAGYYLPQIIVANNFTGVSAAAAVSVPVSASFSPDDALTAKQRMYVNGSTAVDFNWE